MTLLEEIQNAAVDSHTDLGALLRKCKVLAARLDSKPLEDWLIWESNSYPKQIEVPGYRKWSLVLKGTFEGFGAMRSNVPVPRQFVPNKYRDSYTWYRCRDSVAGIQQLLKKGGSEYCIPLTDLAPLLQVFEGDTCIQCVGVFAAGHLVEILNAVRNRVLDFVLALQKEDPKAGQGVEGSSRISPSRVTQIFNTNIYGGVANVLGTAQDSSVTFNVQASSFETLKALLENNGVNQTDIEDLRKALQADPKPTVASSYGPRVSAWIARMTGKAASGAWKVGLGAAGNLLAQAIARYYGLSL